MRRVAGVWAPLGVSALFGFAIVRLGLRGLHTVATGLTPLQWLALLASLVVFIYGEGVLALQRSWVPRLLERAQDVQEEKNVVFQLLAPLYGMSLIGASSRGLARGWGMCAALLLAVVILRSVPDPWRGIIDLSVAAALAWGLLFVASGTVRIAGRITRSSA